MPDDPNVTTDHPADDLGQTASNGSPKPPTPTAVVGSSTAVGGEPDTVTGIPRVRRYDLLSELGRGAMGVVYQARDLHLNRLVALKMVLGGDTADPNRHLRFLVEAEAVAAVKHPHVVQVYEFGDAGGRPFLALEYLSGGTLADRLGAALPPPAAAGLVAPIARGVAAAHERGIVHRDLKPGNVLFDAAGVPKVTDFGLAKLGTGSGLTESHAVMGTPAYMSPEQAWGNAKFVGPQADVWALGVILYQALTGQRPFDGESVRVLLTRVVTTDPVPPRRLAPAVPRDLELICSKCLAKQPHERYPTAKELADDLERFARGESISVRPAGLVERASKWTMRNKVLAGSAAAVLVVTAAAAWWTDRQRVEREGERRAGELRQQLADERRAAEERQRLARNGDAVEGRLARGEEALRAGDAPTAALMLDEAQKGAPEGGADHLADRTARDRSELALHRELDRIDEVRWTMDSTARWVTRAARDEWPAAFARFGIVPGTTPTEQAVRRVTGFVGTGRVLASLHLWLLASHSKPLADILNAADPDEYRTALRAATAARDDARVADLASRPELLAQPPWFERMLLGHPGVPGPRRTELLNAAYERRPGDVNVLMDFAHLRPVGAPGAGPEREKWMRATVAVRPHSAAAWNNLGVALYEQGELDKAIAAYRRAGGLGSASALAHNNLGVALLDAGDRDGAAAAFRKSIELEPSDPRPHSNLGNVLRDAGDRDGADRALRRAIELDPEFAEGHNNLGNLLLDKGDRDGAIRAYTEATRLAPRLVPPFLNLAAALKQAGKLDAAVVAYREALKLDPADAEIHNDLGVALYFQKDFAGAVAAYQEAIRRNPKLLVARNNLGNALRDKGDLPGAVAAYRKAVEIDPKFAPAHHNLGKVLQTRGDFAGAVVAYEKAAAADPKLPRVYHDLGFVLFSQKKWNEAAAAYRKAVALDPKDASAHANLGLMLMYAEDFDPAVAAYKDALALNPKDATTHLNLGSVYLARERYPEAVACARAALRIDPKLAGAHAQLGMALREAGDIPGARAALTEAARLDPNRWGPFLANLPPLPTAPPPREVKP